MDDGLFIDILHLPPNQNTGKLLVISSGVHGVEGYPGSAVQQMFLNELLSSDVISEMGVLIIHGVNPYGFKFQRRVSENNVDLNRGSDTVIKTARRNSGLKRESLMPIILKWINTCKQFFQNRRPSFSVSAFC